MVLSLVPPLAKQEVWDWSVGWIRTLHPRIGPWAASADPCMLETGLGAPHCPHLALCARIGPRIPGLGLGALCCPHLDPCTGIGPLHCPCPAPSAGIGLCTATVLPCMQDQAI